MGGIHGRVPHQSQSVPCVASGAKFRLGACPATSSAHEQTRTTRSGAESGSWSGARSSRGSHLVAASPALSEIKIDPASKANDASRRRFLVEIRKVPLMFACGELSPHCARQLRRLTQTADN